MIKPRDWRELIEDTPESLRGAIQFRAVQRAFRNSEALMRAEADRARCAHLLAKLDDEIARIRYALASQITTKAI